MSELSRQQGLTPAQRFANGVVKQIQMDEMEFTPKMKQAAQNYFVKVDSVLKESSLKAKQDDLPYKWENVNLEKLTRDAAQHSKTGLNPLMKNHIFPIPYKNAKTQKYDITFIIGYEGIKTVSKKYALDEFIDGIVHLVYERDHFKPLYKSVNIEFDTYEFEVTEPFNRGEVIGGFYYQQYKDPSLNKLAHYSVAELEKRKPKSASPEFWGGEKDEWNNGQRTGGKLKIEGWREEMLKKTLERMCYEKVLKDGDKIDAEYMAYNSLLEDTDKTLFDQPKTEDAEATVVSNKEVQGSAKVFDPFKDEEMQVVDEVAEVLNGPDASSDELEDLEL